MNKQKKTCSIYMLSLSTHFNLLHRVMYTNLAADLVFTHKMFQTQFSYFFDMVHS